MMFSTAGDQGSTVLLQLREQGIAAIDSGQPTAFVKEELTTCTNPGCGVFPEEAVGAKDLAGDCIMDCGRHRGLRELELLAGLTVQMLRQVDQLLADLGIT